MDSKDEIIIQAGIVKNDPTNEAKEPDVVPDVSGIEVNAATQDKDVKPQIDQDEFLSEKHEPIQSKNAVQQEVENDLENVPAMSTMQKAIIVLAGLGIVAFVVYYVVFLG